MGPATGRTVVGDALVIADLALRSSWIASLRPQDELDGSCPTLCGSGGNVPQALRDVGFSLAARSMGIESLVKPVQLVSKSVQSPIRLTWLSESEQVVCGKLDHYSLVIPE